MSEDDRTSSPPGRNDESALATLCSYPAGLINDSNWGDVLTSRCGSGLPSAQLLCGVITGCCSRNQERGGYSASLLRHNNVRSASLSIPVAPAYSQRQRRRRSKRKTISIELELVNRERGNAGEGSAPPSTGRFDPSGIRPRPTSRLGYLLSSSPGRRILSTVQNRSR